MDLNIAIGEFQFSTDTAIYESMQRSTRFRWSEHKRLGQRDAYQYLGPDKQTLTIPGSILPCAGIGDADSLEVLRDMGAAGEAYYLVDITGWVHGRWIVLSVDDDRDEDGNISFNLSLKRYD